MHALAFSHSAESPEAIVPYNVVFHKIDALAFNCVGKDEDGLVCGRPGFVECITNLIEVVAINLDDVEAERTPFVRERFKHHNIFGASVDHQSVAVNDGDHVGQFEVCQRHRRFPYAAFTAFAVAHETHGSKVLFQIACAKAQPDGHGQSVPKAAGRCVAANDLVAVRMHRKGRAEVVERSEIFLGKIAAFGKRRYKTGCRVSFRQYETVSVFPVGVLGVDIEILEVEAP